MEEHDVIFYAGIEEGVRPWVRMLRNVGANTECSCHHEGYIQCQSLDPTTEIDRVRRVFFGKLDNYRIEVIFVQDGPDAAHWHQTMEITSDSFKIGSDEASKDRTL